MAVGKFRELLPSLLFFQFIKGWRIANFPFRFTVKLPETHNATMVHNHFMGMALQQARRAGKMGEVPIGAVVVRPTRDGRYEILSQAYNLVETRQDASAHAELLALKQAAKKVKNWRLLNATLYASLEPCPMCLTACQAFRISSIVYAAPDLRLGAIESHVRLLDIPHPFHSVQEVVPGIQKNESAELLRSFFRERRKTLTESNRKDGWRSWISRFLMVNLNRR